MDLQTIVKNAIDEDLPCGDLTTDNLALNDKTGRAKLLAKEDLVLSGVEAFTLTFQQIDPDIQLNWQFTNGQFILKGQTLCALKGPLSSLLKGERVALNFLGHLSGVATLTRCYVDQIKHTKAKILDTRKTTPGLRQLEKQAVVHGGGFNHRLNLSEAILIKENHIRAVGSLKEAVLKLKKKRKDFIEVEVRNIEEVSAALECRADRLLLDNMSDTEMSEALKLIPTGVETEASGNITIDRAQRVAELGVNFISVGALTHSAPCVDLSMLFE
ncbi:MAG: nicotinate-nucleotide diphosphorylase (carboxylating) [Bdellovibrionales bacterium RBG_16_40_8]|nr:MAG: nicotinate-nucleotide diphosphorylase (carboxylating) [Bdellovibrionales bacterium RBG_16_40_8]